MTLRKPTARLRSVARLPRVAHPQPAAREERPRTGTAVLPLTVEREGRRRSTMQGHRPSPMQGC